ncbi:MAG: hypothetical protein IT379_30655 [Deltaproteobacteria bacterium]|nr:hypothetical protein [Deltaproteobacteria bacterium]
MRPHRSLRALVLGAGVLVAAQAVAQEPPTPVARVVLFTQQGCPACAAVEREVLPALRARFGARLELRELDCADPDDYAILLRVEARGGVRPEERVVPTVVVDDHLLHGLDDIRTRLGGVVESVLATGGSEWPAGVESVGVAPGGPGERSGAAASAGGAEHDAPDGGTAQCAADACTPMAARRATIWATYFFQTGCRNCSRAEADIRYVQLRVPGLRVERLNVYDETPLALSLTARAGRRDFETPAIFIGRDALLGPDEVTAEMLEHLARRYAERGAPRLSRSPRDEDASGAIVRRFRSFGVLAVVAAGLVDGINPCAFATLVFFVSYLSASGRKGKQILIVGAAFTLGLFVAYVAVGLGLYRLLDLLGGALASAGRWVMGLTALLCAGLAVASFVDFLRARRGELKDMSLNLPESLRRAINAVIRRGRHARLFVLFAFVTGVVVSLLELACTGQVYLPTIIFVTGVPEMRAQAVAYLLLYNVMFVVPLVVVFVLVYFGTTSQQLTAFLKGRAAAVKMGLVVLFASMAVWLSVAALSASS